MVKFLKRILQHIKIPTLMICVASPAGVNPTENTM